MALHPLLAPAYFDEPRALRNYVNKPKLSREGANIAVVRDGKTVAHTGGEYGADGYIYQAFANAEVDGHFPVLGAWVIDGEAAGCGIREGDTPITDNLSRFVPHAILGR